MTIRPTSQEDAKLIQAWIDRDPDHADKTDAEFFAVPRPEATHFTVLDGHENPLFFVTLEKTVRGHIQFNPWDPRLRTAKGLMFLGGFLRTALRKLNVAEFITESRHAPLVGFLERALGLHKLVADYGAAVPKE